MIQPETKLLQENLKQLIKKHREINMLLEDLNSETQYAVNKSEITDFQRGVVFAAQKLNEIMIKGG